MSVLQFINDHLNAETSILAFGVVGLGYLFVRAGWEHIDRVRHIPEGHFRAFLRFLTLIFLIAAGVYLAQLIITGSGSAIVHEHVEPDHVEAEMPAQASMSATRVESRSQDQESGGVSEDDEQAELGARKSEQAERPETKDVLAQPSEPVENPKPVESSGGPALSSAS